MKTIWIVLIVLMFSSFSFANDKYPDIKARWDKRKAEQKYRFLHQIREERFNNRMRIVKVRHELKVRRWQYVGYYGNHGRSSIYGMHYRYSRYSLPRY